MSYTKLSHSILTSTLWMEDDATRLVWVTMLAMKDRHGEVMGSIPGLANVARVPVEACRKAIAKFLSPDPDSRTTDHEGRRIEAIKGGWLVLNHETYRDMDSDEDRKRKDAIRQQRARDRKKANSSRCDGVTNHTSSAIQITDTDTDVNKDKNTKDTIVRPADSRSDYCDDSEPIRIDPDKHPTAYGLKPDAGWEKFWDAYGKKRGMPKSKALWEKLSIGDRDAALGAVDGYVASTPDVKFRQDPQRWLRNRGWEDELPDAPPPNLIEGSPEWWNYHAMNMKVT